MLRSTRFFASAFFVVLIVQLTHATPKAIDVIQSAGHLEEHQPNFCNRTDLALENGLQKTALGQFLGYPCSGDFYHCRWQSDGYRTYKKSCRVGLVFDTAGTQNCNYDYNVKGCAITSNPEKCANATDFSCSLSEHCVSIGQRCDGVYDCVLEEDEQNCPMCKQNEFPCVISEQCVPMTARCNGVQECKDGTDEQNCDTCPADNFFCRKSQKCIPATEHCDGIVQCPQGEDEQLCKRNNANQMYMCENRQTQVPRKLVCNGKPDCPDGSDEKYCLHPVSDASALGEKFIEDNTVSENVVNSNGAAAESNFGMPSDDQVPTPILSDKTPPGTGRLLYSASFPRIRFNGHNVDNADDHAEDDQQQPQTVKDVSSAIVTTTDRGETNVARTASTEILQGNPDLSTSEPYVVPSKETLVDELKPPTMHIMKKYRPPSEKYMTETLCGSQGVSDTEQVSTVEEVPNAIEENKQTSPEYKLVPDYLHASSVPPSVPSSPSVPLSPSAPFYQQPAATKAPAVLVCAPPTPLDCSAICPPCIDIPDFVGQQGRRQFTSPTTVNLFYASTQATPSAVHHKLDPLQELSKRYGTSRTELLKKIEQILRNETVTTINTHEPMFAPPGAPLSTTESSLDKTTNTIHVTGRLRKWQPSLSTNDQRPKTTTDAAVTASTKFFRSFPSSTRTPLQTSRRRGIKFL